MKTIFLSTFLVVLCSYVIAQEKLLPNLNIRDFTTPPQTHVLDSNAHAVVIIEKGKSDIEVSDTDRKLRVVHDYAVRIKILDQEGFDKANYTIPLYKIGGDFEYIKNITGFTYNEENGRISTYELDKKAIFTEKVNDYVTLTKFTLPNIQENSIIEINYQLHSTDIFNYRTWNFQEDIPKIHSEYTAIMPAMYQYAVTLRGVYKLSDQKSNILRSYFLINGNRVDCSKMTYIMKDIAPFQEESYMLAAKNYKSAIYFELEQYYTTSGSRQLLTKEWKNVDRELLTDKNFGGQLSRENAFKDILPTLLTPANTEEEKARVIYDYIKAHIRWNKFYGKYGQFGVKELLEKRSGNSGDINLALIAALNAADLECYPVILSTRENGLPNSLHPVITDFNYVIAYVKIGEKSFFLDATERNIPFGLLPLRCINGQGRVIYSRKSSEWINLENFYLSSLSYDITGEMNEKGIVRAKVNIFYNGLEALNRRNIISSFASTEEYIENRIQQITGFEVESGSVINFDDLNQPLIEELLVSIDFSNSIRENQFIFNPILINRISRNPFNLEERTYPVDMGAKRAESLFVRVKLPEGYVIEDAPKNIAFSLPETSARYTYQSRFKENELQLDQSLSLNRAIYSVDEYFHLKEFYSRIIQHQKIDFLFKKQM